MNFAIGNSTIKYDTAHVPSTTPFVVVAGDQDFSAKTGRFCYRLDMWVIKISLKCGLRTDRERVMALVGNSTKTHEELAVFAKVGMAAKE